MPLSPSKSLRRRLVNGAVGVLVLAGAGLGWVVAQEAQISPPAGAVRDDNSQAPPPSEATPPPGAISVDAAGLPTAPVPYKSLEATRQRSRPSAARQSRPQSAPVQAAGPLEALPTVKRPRHPVAILQAVDKVTAETLRFEAEVGKPVRYKTLVFTLRACETEASDELIRESAAHLTITSQPKAQPGRVQPEPAQVYRGWMFASSPGLNPFEHSVYDAWLVSCKVPEVAEPAPGEIPPAPGTTPRRRAPATTAQAAVVTSPG